MRSHALFFFLYTLLSVCVCFFSLLLSLVFLTMAPKVKKSIPSKNPISRHASTSSSIPPYT